MPLYRSLGKQCRPRQTAPGQEQSDHGLHCLLFETLLTSPILYILGNFAYSLSFADFSKLTFKNLSGLPSECQTVWIQIRPYEMSSLIWVQTVCKGYQQKTHAGKELITLFSGILSLITTLLSFIN